MVYDGSAKHGPAEISINDCLKKGPNLVPFLFNMLVKFRGYPIGIVADVEKAFHQIGIHPDDRRMLLFRSCGSTMFSRNILTLYTMSSIGLCLDWHQALLFCHHSTNIICGRRKKIHWLSHCCKTLYVDDGGAQDDKQALKIYECSNKIMNDGGFSLRKWTSNSKAFRTHVAVNQHTKTLTKGTAPVVSLIYIQ